MMPSWVDSAAGTDGGCDALPGVGRACAGLLGLWQRIFVPHMQLAMRKQLERQPTAWTEPALVAQELATRR
jgi:hypothetical protein